MKIFKDPVFRFFIKGFLLFVVWDLIVYPFLIPGYLHQWVTQALAQISEIILRVHYSKTFFVHDTLYINNVACVHVGIPCNGIETMGIICCIIIAYEATYLQKLWFLLFNFIVIFFLNALRIAALTALVFEKNQSFDVNHKFIFNIILYGILLTFFAIWSRKTRKRNLLIQKL